jgi:ferric-dicitrate binding protein FerR (iron transport regulator)
MYMANVRLEQPEAARLAAAARELDDLVAVARTEAPPTLGALAERRMVRAAHAAHELRAAQRRRRTRYAFLCAAAALLLCLGGYAHLSLGAGTEIAVAAHGLPLRLSLKTGDTLVLAPSSQLEVLAEKPALRRVRLARGSALFDVTRHNRAQRFEVSTPHAEVHVRGTVFTVEVSSERSVVRVHEGSVSVLLGREPARSDAKKRILHAGDVWASDQKPPARPSHAELTLASEVAAALAARGPALTAQPVEPAPEPQVTPARAATEALPLTPRAAAHPTPRETTLEAGASAAPVPELDRLRTLLQRGQADEVIAQARVPAQTDDAYLWLLADALRAQGRLEDALTSYEALASRTGPPARAQAGFAAAQIALVSQRDPARALRDIEQYQLERADSGLRERASVLHVDALLLLGRNAEARELAARYLAQQPETETSARMRRVLSERAREQSEDASGQTF